MAPQTDTSGVRGSPRLSATRRDHWIARAAPTDTRRMSPSEPGLRILSHVGLAYPPARAEMIGRGNTTASVDESVKLHARSPSVGRSGRYH